ncbi:MAG: hypothetical protein JWO38_6483 [Gemmataceae bacterium]|nr:hypothetical protein [Gemmataceae bacterium]
MNAALLMMTSTILAGADAAPGAPVAPPPAVVSAGPGCGPGGCGPVVSGGCCDPCAGSKAGLFDRLKSRMGGGLCGKHKSAACGCAPAPCATCAPAPCNDCGSARPSLLDRLKSKFGKHHKADCGGCDGCAVGTPAIAGCAAPLPPGAAPAVPPSADPPKEMPKPKEIPKVAPPKVSGNGADAGAVPSISIPTPGAVVVPALPVTPVSGPKLNGTTSPY